MTRRLLPMLGLLLLSLPAFAQVQPVPSLMNFQGRLTKPDGTPVTDGTYTVRFSLWTAAANGTEKWNQTVNALLVRNGTFAILLTNFPAATFDGNLYLEVKVGNNAPLTPRQQLVSVAYAQKAQLALTVPNASITGANIANGTITANKLTSGLSFPPNGVAGGDLSGTYPNPALASLFTSLAKVSGGIVAVSPSGLKADQSQVQHDSAFGTGDFVQSFTAGVNGRLVALDVLLGLENGVTSQQGTLTLYAGEGISGTVLSTQSVLLAGPQTWQRLVLATPVALTANAKYSFRISVPSGSMALFGKSANPYPGGMLFSTDNYDSTFMTYVDGQATPSVQVSSNLSVRGTLGVGTDLPQTALHVNDPSGLLIGKNGTAGGYTALGITLSSVQNGNAQIQSVQASGSAWGDLILNANGGNVGVGTTSPQAKLDVNGAARVRSINIIGGADVAEPFHVRENNAVRPGMIVCIDSAKVGGLRLTRMPYDRTVAGIVSGAGGVQPGMTLHQTGTAADGTHPVAMTGRVWALCDATHNPIHPGDLLTTSRTPGHAMRVSNYRQAPGAVIGKAMSSLSRGKGLVLVLVRPQ